MDKAGSCRSRSNIEILESRIAPATLVVTNLDNDGTGSLRAAISKADGASGDRIVFRAGLHGTLTIASDLPTITSSMTIAGPGAHSIVINGDNIYDVFRITDGNNTVDSPVTISGLSITNSHTTGFGGGIFSTESLTLNGVIISGCTATHDGGGLYIRPDTASAKVTISNSVITGNTSGNWGGAMFEYGAKSLTLVRTVVSDNSAGAGSKYGGGGIYAEVNTTGSELTIALCKFTGNKAGYAGGLVLNDADSAPASKVTISNSVITGNSALAGSAGGLRIGNNYVGAGNVSIIGSTISDNAALDAGGLFGANFSALTITGGVIASNKATNGTPGGGGLAVEGTGSVKIVGAKILDNTSAGDGGGVLAGSGVSLTMVSCNVSGNSASSSGGGVDCSVVSALTISGSLIAGNKAGSNNPVDTGGGVHIDGVAPLTVTGSRILDNTSSGSGGGVFVGNGASLTMVSCNVSGNSATASAGGGVYAAGPTGGALNVTVTGGLFSGNTSADAGGGIFLSNLFGDSTLADAGVIAITGARVTGNTANAHGGGGLSINTFGAVTLKDVTAFKNVATSGSNADGGGFQIDNSMQLTITGCVIRANTSGEFGGGLYLGDDTSGITRSAITGNVADTAGGGLYTDQGGITLTASEVTGNKAPTDPNIGGTVSMM